jgi:hypothetical protein
MSGFLDQIAALSAAEEFFQALGVDFEPEVVAVKRLHILKRFNQRLAALDTTGLDDAALRDVHAAALRQAYGEIAAVEPHQAKLFKVFNQPDPAAPRAPARAFVPLSAVTR